MLMFIDSGEGMPQTPEGQAVYQRIGEWFGRLGQEGKLRSGEELQAVRTATTVRFNRGQPVVTHRPLLESQKVVRGFALVDPARLHQALQIAQGLARRRPA